MIVIRGGTLPRWDVSVKQASDDFSDALNRRAAWNYAPQLTLSALANKDELDYTDRAFDRTEEAGSFQKMQYSYYNLTADYPDGTLVWNAFSDGTAFLNPEEADDLRRWKGGPRTSASKLARAFAALGFLTPEGTNEREVAKHQIYEHSLVRGDLINVVILPTQDCNARCFYCFEQTEAHEKMSEETIRETVAYLSRVLTPEKQVVFQWFGGEPLYAPDIIEKIIRGVDEAFQGKLDFTSKIVTNGSLIDERILELFLHSWRVKKVQLTIDGYREEHDRRKSYADGRKDAYHALLKTIRTLLENDIFVVCRINLDKDNISQLDDILNDLEPFNGYDQFFIHPSTLRKAQADHNAGQPDIEDHYYGPDSFHEFYKTVLDKMFAHGIYKSPYNILPMRCRNNCYACSSNAVLINAQGGLFRCEQFSLAAENQIGTVATGIIMNDAYFEWDKIGGIDRSCSDCRFLPVCNGGCRYNRMQNRASISPCTRQRFYLDVIFDRIYKLVKHVP